MSELCSIEIVRVHTGCGERPENALRRYVEDWQHAFPDTPLPTRYLVLGEYDRIRIDQLFGEAAERRDSRDSHTEKECTS